MTLDDLKCCGNCLYRYSDYPSDIENPNVIEHCEKERHQMGSYELCKEWEWDSFTMKERI